METRVNILILLLLWPVLIINFACSGGNTTNTVENDSTALKLPTVKMGNFYETDLNSSNSIVLADSISYDVTIKNPDPQDTWLEEDIGKMDEEALANIILNAVYNGRLTPYSYQYETPMTMEEVKDLESKYSRDKVARMRFTEEWYFDEKELQFGKRVNSIMIAYQRINSTGEARYVPGVKVYLTDKSKNPVWKNIE